MSPSLSLLVEKACVLDIYVRYASNSSLHYSQFDGLFSGSSEVHPIKQAFDGVLPLMDGNDVILMSSQNLSFPLHLMEPKLLGAEPTVIREDSFRVEEGKNSWVQKELCGGFKNITADSVTLTGECYLVLEWTATLSEQTVLKNTVGQVRT